MTEDRRKRAREERITVPFNSLYKAILSEELAKRGTNLSEILREKVDYVVNNNKEVYIINPSRNKFSFHNYKRDTSVVFKIDKSKKERFKELIKSGTMSGYISIQIVELVPKLFDKSKYQRLISFIEHKVLNCIERNENDYKIVYHITKGEKRIDIYLEPIIKEKYLEIINKLGIDYSTHLRYFVSKAVEKGEKITTSKKVSGNRTSQLTIVVNEKEYEQFRALFIEGSSISTYFRDIILEEIRKIGVRVEELLYAEV